MQNHPLDLLRSYNACHEAISEVPRKYIVVADDSPWVDSDGVSEWTYDEAEEIRDRVAGLGYSAYVTVA